MKFNKVIIIVVVALFFWAILAFQYDESREQAGAMLATSTPVSVPTASPEKSDLAVAVSLPKHEPNFINKVYGVSFWYPAGWTLREHDPNEYVYTDNHFRSSRLRIFSVSDGQGHEVAVSVSKGKSSCSLLISPEESLRLLTVNKGQIPIAVQDGPTYEYGSDVYFLDSPISKPDGSRGAVCGYEQGNLSYNLTYFYPYTETLSAEKMREMDTIVSSMFLSAPTKPIVETRHSLESDVQTWKTYVDARYGFSFKFPKEYGPFVDVTQSYHEYKPEVLMALAASSTVSVAGEHLGGLSVQIYPLGNYDFIDRPGGTHVRYDLTNRKCLGGDSGMDNDTLSEYTIQVAGVTACGVGTGDAGYAFSAYAIPDQKNNIMIQIGISYEPGYYQSVDLKALLTTFRFKD